MDGRALAAGELGRARGSAGRAARDAGVGHRPRLAGQSAAPRDDRRRRAACPCPTARSRATRWQRHAGWGRPATSAWSGWWTRCCSGSGPTAAGTAPRAWPALSRLSTSLIPTRLWEYALATGIRRARQAANRTAELFPGPSDLPQARLGEPIHPSMVAPLSRHWHYDVLQALHLLARMGKARDERTGDALDLLEQRRLPDGRWRPGGYWWSPPGSARARRRSTGAVTVPARCSP